MSVKPNSRRRAHSMGGSFIRNNNRSTPMAFTTSRMPPLTRTTYKPKPFVPRLHVPIQGPLCKSHSTHSNSDEKLLSPSLASLDLPITSFSLPNFREVALSYISDMEQRLMSLDPKASQELALEEIASFMKEGMTLLERLKDEFGAHLPDFDFDEIFSFDHALADVRSKFSEFDFPDVRARLPDFDFHLFSRVSVSFDEARQRLSHLDLSIPSIPVPQSYILALRSRLSSLHDRISDLSLNSQNLTLSSMGTPGRMLAELLGDDDDDTNDGKILDLHGRDLARALASSCNGAKLIIYEVLPQKWRNNEFVHTGYRCATLIHFSECPHDVNPTSLRFIPFSSWPSLVLSIFRLHNETRQYDPSLATQQYTDIRISSQYPYPLPSTTLYHSFHLPASVFPQILESWYVRVYADVIRLP
ncbi:hypothetical protein FRC02_009332 [Tulasnella sp. 418]|nr:hypothetical protein FRC02_009332 [Tulasnella sp. 418]